MYEGESESDEKKSRSCNKRRFMALSDTYNEGG